MVVDSKSEFSTHFAYIIALSIMTFFNVIKYATLDESQ